MATKAGTNAAQEEHHDPSFLSFVSGVHTKQLRVTPAMAEEWLKTNNNNRSVNARRVAYFVQQILEGNWALTHQGIAFWDDETLADGQHRLMAIVRSGVAVNVLVTTGLKKQAIHAVDMVRPRSTKDVLHFIGMRISGQNVSCARVLYLQRMMAKEGNESWTNAPIQTEKLAAFASLAMPAIEFAFPLKKQKGVAHSCVQAAIASAWFTQDRERLYRFKQLLADGLDANSEESAAIRLRDYVLTSGQLGGGSNVRQQLFLRSCTALRAFLEGRGLSKLYCRPEAAFDIPEDVDI